MKFNVRIEDEVHGENHTHLTLSQALGMAADGMMWGTVTIKKSDEQVETEEKIDKLKPKKK